VFLISGTEGLNRARAVYSATRSMWFAETMLDAHERLSLASVTSGLRPFAFLNHLPARSRKNVSELLSSIGLPTRICNVRFDLAVRVPSLSGATVDAYKA